MVELPLARKQRFIRDYGLPAGDAQTFVWDQSLGNYFETAAKASKAAEPAPTRELRDLNKSYFPFTPVKTKEAWDIRREDAFPFDVELVSASIAEFGWQMEYVRENFDPITFGTLFDILDGPLPDPATPAPPRFLPVYDNVLLSHADRTRIVRTGHRKRTGYMEGVNFGSVLIDGFVGATWSLKRGPNGATLRITLLDRLPKDERVAVETEGARLLTFVAADAISRDVTLVTSPG